jgi:hypothetical protein
VMLAWVRMTFTELQARFDGHADAYRAQLGRLASRDGSVTDEEAVAADLAALSNGFAAGPAETKAPGAAA